MDQFKNSWEFLFSNWKFFLILALPLITVQTLTGYLIMPLAEMTQPEDFLGFFESNSGVIALVGIIGLIVQISFMGGIWMGYMSIDANKTISPIAALQAGLSKFFPLFGAYIVVTIASALGYLMLILPGIYLSARFSLFVAHIMFEDNKVFQSIGASWEKTDEHGSRLFMFTLIFVLLILFSVLIVSNIVPAGYVQAVINSSIEYVMTIPLGYIYFTLYKSIKTN